jgi:hypothetical protein
MVEKVKCKTENCTAMILPSTAESTGGVCMPCKRRADQIEYEEYIRKNRRTVDPFKGITDPVEILKIRHEPRKQDPLIAYLPHSTPPVELYEKLTEPEVSRLIQHVLDNMGSSDNEAASEIAKELAAFTDADLTQIQRASLNINKYYPGYIFRGASSNTASELIDRLGPATERQHDTVKVSHILEALAWAGTNNVLSKFAEWREQPPHWRSLLYIPPEHYAHCAAWELEGSSQMRKLFLGKCYPLIKSEGSDIGPVTTCMPIEESCKWCGGPLTSIFAFDLTNALLDFIPFLGSKLTIATCEVCSTVGDHLYMKVGPDGEALWFAGSERPKYLPKDSGTWNRLPANVLSVSPKPRLLHHAVDWCLPTTCSQIGGMPSWIDDPAHDQCPECGKGFVFVAQLAIEDVDAWGEGIYYALLCPDCSITAVRYQQT